MSDLGHDIPRRHADETYEAGVDRMACDLCVGLTVQARRDSITKLCRSHGIKVEWEIGHVRMRVGGQTSQFDAAQLTLIEKVVESAIRQHQTAGCANAADAGAEQ